jgi:predicted PurR-regulated permease PerM
MAAGGPSTRVIVRIFLTVALLFAALYFLYLIRSVVYLVIIAGFVAVALGPAVDGLNRLRMPRSMAIVLVYLGLAGAIVGVGLLFVPPLASGVQSLGNDAPAYVQKLRNNPTLRKYDNRYHVTRRLQEQAALLPAKLGSAASTLSSVTVGVFSAIVQLITVLTIAFFLLLDGGRYVRWGLALLPPPAAGRAGVVAGSVYRAVGGYITGNLAISVIAGLVSFVTLTVLAVPFALPLSVLMGFFDLIPLVGATIGAVIVGIVTLFNGFPTSTIVWTIVQIVYQQVESSVIVPIVYRRTVEVNGLVTIIAVLIGANLLGILGALLAIPVAGAIQILLKELWLARREYARNAVIDPPTPPPQRTT